MATSDLMVLVLNNVAHRHISKQFKLRETAKIYQAIVFDRVQQDSSEIYLEDIC